MVRAPLQESRRAAALEISVQHHCLNRSETAYAHLSFHATTAIDCE
jgi:hypothetical protein